MNFVILLILSATAFLRANWYGDLRLSIGNAETGSYRDSSRAPLLSWKIFAGQRLFTTNIIFKMANDPQNCPVTAYSEPARGLEGFRANQLCFEKIALLQNFLAIFGWSFLAWTTAKWVQNPFTKIIAATVVVVFGFTPQIAEWESILSPESLSLSMFAITLGLAQETVLRVSASANPFQSKIERSLLAGWIIFFLLWVFVRDVHLYAIPITLVLIALLLIVKKFRNTKSLAIPITLIILFIFFIIGFVSARDSLRATRYPVINALDEFIWPHPQRIAYFKEFGMPERMSPYYQEWADVNATKAYGIFLLSHPGFIATTLWEYTDQLKSDFIQPYFFAPEVKNRSTLLIIGEMFHPQTSAVYLISLLLLLALVLNASQFRTPSLLAWGWLAVWVFAIAAVTLLLSFFGDTWGIRRHIMPSVEMFRLFIWVFMMPFLDLSLKQFKFN
ncbi:MAG: hypothetical protein FJZ86_00475 [Chloroflexi bacterium]|nr:hypothetical protein [Chloroflexota bacterium]